MFMIRTLTEQARVSLSEIRCEMTDDIKLAAYALDSKEYRAAIHSLIQLAEDAARNARELTESLDVEEQK